MKNRFARLRALWRTAYTSSDLGLTGPEQDVVLEVSRYREVLEWYRQAQTPEQRRRKAHNYALQVLGEAERLQKEITDEQLGAVLEETRDYIAEQDLLAATRLENIVRAHDGAPQHVEPSTVEPIDLDRL